MTPDWAWWAVLTGGALCIGIGISGLAWCAWQLLHRTPRAYRRTVRAADGRCWCPHPILAHEGYGHCLARGCPCLTTAPRGTKS